MNPDYNHLLIDYLSGQLSPYEKAVFERELAVNPELRQETKELRATLELLEKPDSVTPPASMDTDFYVFLQQEQQANEPLAKIVSLAQPRNPWAAPFRYAAGVALLGVAFWAGRWSVVESAEPVQPQLTQQNEPAEKTQQLANEAPNKETIVLNEIVTLKKEMQATKELVMLSMLKQESASERIKAVNFSYELSRPEQKVLMALVHTLNHDPSSNVRLAVVDALSHFGNEKQVRDALIHTLTAQQDPMLQMAVIETLVSLKEKRALPEIQKLTIKEDIPDFVREKAEEGVRYLAI